MDIKCGLVVLNTFVLVQNLALLQKQLGKAIFICCKKNANFVFWVNVTRCIILGYYR
jgi:hypothetical protein